MQLRSTIARGALAVSLCVSLLLCAIAAQAGGGSDLGVSEKQLAKYRGWVEKIKTAPRGPFSRIRWFCADGTVLPPKAYACKKHGGGIQHGEWTDQVVEMRKHGFYVANVLAAVDPKDFLGKSPDLDQLSQIVLERFLIGADDGWVMRGAFSYRGALQAEDEEAGASKLMLALLGSDFWRDPARYALLREAARLLPLEQDSANAATVRKLALDIANQDNGFQSMRVKIHGSPDGGDAQRVREYAKGGKKQLNNEYARLADLIDELYSARGASDELRRLAGTEAGRDVAKGLQSAAADLESAADADARLTAASRWLVEVRKKFEQDGSPASSLVLLQASIALERQVYTSGADVVAAIAGKTRRERLLDVAEAAEALYGAGFLSTRQLDELSAAVARIQNSRGIRLRNYRNELRYLARAPEWSSRALSFQFSRSEGRFSPLEPLTHMYAQDRLRGSPLLVYGAVIDSLVKDANAMAGIQHRLFGVKIGAGLRALNPGMARGRLYVDANPGVDVDRNGIYLLPETVSDLPPVSGILTRGEGSSLSHVQLLARNLGIPNVVVTESVLPQVAAQKGKNVVMAVSPKGVVQLAEDGSRWDTVFGVEEAATEALVIKPDLQKLDTSVTKLVPLADLRAEDSGRISGPKGANLGSLRHYFGDAVPDGFVVPFGVFRQTLEKPIEAGGPSVWNWMRAEYDAIAALDRSPKQQQARVKSFLSRLRTWILAVDLGEDFRQELRTRLRQQFGKDKSYGAFVRSDTNVEDLPGFTGAGLNLTVANVVGEAAIEKAIHDVWASPFTERAYSWRQGNMEDPEYVFPAVVVQYSLPSEKSGVMVTADLDTGSMRTYLSVAVSEGVGGAVDGQATESLRINKRNGQTRLLAQATAPMRTVLLRSGGVSAVPASGTDAVLQPKEIAQLIEFAEKAPERFPSLHEGEKQVPADIEFGFRKGRLYLLQLRPFVESKAAQANTYLAELDQVFRSRGRLRVDLDQRPEGGL